MAMEMNESEEEEETLWLKSLGKKSTRKLSDINVVDEQELRTTMSNIEPKHQKEVESLLDGYKSLYSNWVLQLRVEGSAPYYKKKKLSAPKVCGFSVMLTGLHLLERYGMIEEHLAPESKFNFQGYTKGSFEYDFKLLVAVRFSGSMVTEHQPSTMLILSHGIWLTYHPSKV